MYKILQLVRCLHLYALEYLLRFQHVIKIYPADKSIRTELLTVKILKDKFMN